MKKITLLLADDHHVVRAGFRALLETQEDFEIIGEAKDGQEAVQLTEELRPDILLLDLMMPVLNGLEVTRQVQKITRVIILSMHSNESYVLEALRNGAFGYELKDCTAAELILAIHTVYKGDHYLCSPFSERAINYYANLLENDRLDPFKTLTSRERQILQMVAEGMTSSQISEQLSISPRTVETHRNNLMQKLDLHSQTDLIRFAIKKGIIPLDG